MSPSMFRRVRNVLFAGAMALAVPSWAAADSIDFTGVGHASAVKTKITSGGTTYTKNVWAGELNWNWLGTTPVGFGTSFYSYCIDLLTPLRDPQAVTVRGSAGFTNGVTDGGAKAAWLFNQYAAGIRANTNVTQANTWAAALQVAIWEATYDSLNSLTGGNFKLVTTGAIATQASTYLSALYYAPGFYHTDSATVLESALGQDQITTTPVNEPATALLLGLATILVVKRRRALGVIETSS